MLHNICSVHFIQVSKPVGSFWLSHENQANIEAFNMFQYLDFLLNIVHEYFEQMVNTIYPKEL